MRWMVLLFLLIQPLYSYALDVGEAAPNFETITLENKQISYDSNFKGKKPVYLIFWATW
jgi:hypothetical protein